MSQFHWLLLGALSGYVLLMWTNPVRRSLLDGLRVVRRYPSLWVILGLCGFSYALFYLGARAWMAWATPTDVTLFSWTRAPFRWDVTWLYGEETSLWYLPPNSLFRAVHEAWLPALESTAGIFNNLVSTFPLASVAAVILWVNWKGHQGVLLAALRKRFGFAGWFLHLAVLICATAAIAKPALLFFAPPIEPDIAQKWQPIVSWLAFLFEYGVGVGVQIYLILLSYCWFRGITFTSQHLIDVAIRRFSCVIRWAVVVMLLSTAFIDLPLILRNFPSFDRFLPADRDVFEERIALVRALLAIVLLLFATVQITLTFHSESLGRGFLDHFRFVARHGWPLLWIIAVAGLHFYALHVLNLLILRGLGEGTAAAIVWELAFPWLNTGLGACLLAAWVGVFRRAENSRAHDASFARF